MRILLLSFILIIYSFNVFAYQITGEIKDAKSDLPIQFATIYVNGTTVGTVSDLNGQFKLSFDMKDCQIVISHVSYDSKVIKFDQNTNTHLNIKLKARIVSIQEISIETKNMKSSNMAYFKKAFLGDDKWGKNASILNDSVIIFNIEYYDDTVSDLSLIGTIKYFEVKATAPLQIELPRLGYRLKYDLIQFNEAYDQEFGTRIINMFGYYYFEEIKTTPSWLQWKIEKNRLNVYYNSTMHFTRSLYANTLKENGYLISKLTKVDSGKYFTFELFDFSSCDCLDYSLKDAYIKGLKGSLFKVKYFPKYSKPRDLNTHDSQRYSYKKSNVAIKKETCQIRANGSLPVGEIIFDGDMVQKRMGAALPFDITF